MHNWVMINMGNQNAMVALAYIREVDNPLKVFCNLIVYSLAKNGKRLTRDELIANMQIDFGISMSGYMIKMCQRMLLSEKRVKIENENYVLIETGNFSIEEFDKEKSRLSQNEDMLIHDLMNYLRQNYNIQWEKDATREKLTKFLLQNNGAYDLFVDRCTFDSCDSKSDGDKQRVNDNWYIGNYISHIITKKEPSYEYLLSVVQGLIIYIGLYQVNDYDSEKSMKYSGTNFYIDTKLVLRLMGFSIASEIESAKEMVDLLVEEYGANICVLEHTIGEVKSALIKASREVKDGEITDQELNRYAIINKYDTENFEIAADSVEHVIKNELKYDILKNWDWNSQESKRYSIDTKELAEYIAQKKSSWNQKAIENDVNAINIINILRKENYDIKFGTKKKLPIFITTNTVLVRCIMEYAKDNDAVKWKKGYLPVITDTFLMYRLWLLSPKKTNNLPEMVLARFAYSAQQSDVHFFMKLRETIKEISEKHQHHVWDLDEERRKKMEETLVRNTNGNIDEINQETLIASIKEAIALENADKDMKISQLQKSNEAMAASSRKKDDEIVDILSDGIIKSIKFKLQKLAMKFFINEQHVAGAIASIFGVISFFVTGMVTSTMGKLSSIESLIIQIGLFVIVGVLTYAPNMAMNDKFLTPFCQKRINHILKMVDCHVEKKIKGQSKERVDSIKENVKRKLY